jgi:alpha-mannosidase
MLEGQLLSSNVSKHLEAIANSGLAHGTFHIIASSHQDIAWMDSPEACMINRDQLLITPALKQLQDHPGYYNDMEDILMLREYLDRHPDKKKEIHDLTLQGRLDWGASYIQPYEEMYLGEPLLRQFYLGRKWFRREFPGCEADIYWNVDVPGRTLQMPQILAGSGVKYMIISRHDRGLFNWASPDGSSVLTYSPGHYYDSYIHLKKGFFETVAHLAELTGFWDRYYPESVTHPVIPVLSDADMALPDSYFDYIETWETLGASRSGEGWKLPRLVHSTAGRFMNEAVSTGIKLPSIIGERPNVWVYIHGPSHYEALKYGRSSGRTLPAAEKLAGIRSVIEGSWNSYPSQQFEKAWESAIYPDHGWGGNQGTVTDSTFLAKFREADSIARVIIRNSAEALASRIDVKKTGIPVVVFNTLSWERTDPVRVSVELPDKLYHFLKLADPDGIEIPAQVAGIPEYYPSGSIKKADILFIADKVPSSGFKTYYLMPARKPETIQAGFEKVGDVVENQFYCIRFRAGGQASLFDKDLGREVWQTDGFGGGELFTMRSVGNGAGEFADVQQPDMEGFERIADHATQWKVAEDGPLYIKIGASGEMRHNKARITWTIYKTIKRLDVSIDLIEWDGTAYREFRLAFPAGLNDPEISYEVPFGVVRVGKDELRQPAGERYLTPCSEVHPRGINNWISASDENLGLTFSSSVAVWDYVNMTDLRTDAVLLQPVLLASRQSCHSLGPLYHQSGSHSMDFSLFTHQPGWQNGYKQALQANEPLLAVFNPKGYDGKTLPDIYSFTDMDDPNTIISTLKKQEDGDGLIIRIYDTEGKDKTVNIRINMGINKVFQTDLLEENGKEIEFTEAGIPLKLGHHSIETLLIKY